MSISTITSSDSDFKSETTTNPEDSDSDDESDQTINSDWRFGPGKYWYDFVRLPYTAQAFGYGMKIDTDYESDEDLCAVPPQNLAPDSDDAFNLVSQIHWEDNIIWNRKQAKKSVKSILRADNYNCGWVVSSHARSLSKKKLRLLSSSSKENQQVTDEFSIAEPPYSIFPIENKELIDSAWEDEIIWDSEKMLKIPKPKMLTIDPNDENVLLQIPDDSAETDVLDDESALCQQQFVQQGKASAASKKAEKDLKIRSLLRKFGIPTDSDDQDKEDLPIIKSHVNNSWNISNDEYYSLLDESLFKLDFTGNQLRHSMPAIKLRQALFPTSLSAQKLLSFHRPHLRCYSHGKIANTDPHVAVSVTKKIKKKAEERQKAIKEAADTEVFFMHTYKDLSATDGELVLAEMSEEYPPLLSQVGMASRIRNFHKRMSSVEARDSSHFDYGENCITMPFLMGKLNPGESIQIIENNMYRAPIYRQNVNEVDFIVIRTRNNYFIREIDAIFTVGQELPLMAVPEPTSREKFKFLQKFFLVHAYRLLRKSKTDPPSISTDELRKTFRNMQLPSIKRHFGKMASYERETKRFILNRSLPDEDEIRELLSPEECCVYYSMLASKERLNDAGYEDKSIPTIGEETEESGQMFMADEVKCASWNTTGAFVSAMQGKCFLELIGSADPTGCGQGFSFVKVTKRLQLPTTARSTVQNRKLTAPKATKKMSLRQAKYTLQKQGFARKEIEGLNRWDTFELLRNVSEKINKVACHSMDEFSRTTNISKRKEIYERQCQAIFEKQNTELSYVDPPSSEDETSDGDDSEADELGKFIEEMILHKKTLPQLTEAKEQAEARELVKNMTTETKSKPEKVQEEPQPSSEPGRILCIYRTIRDGDITYERKETIDKPDLIDAYIKLKTLPPEKLRNFVYAEDTSQKDKDRAKKRRSRVQLTKEKRQLLEDANLDKPPTITVTSAPNLTSVNSSGIDLDYLSDSSCSNESKSSPNVTAKSNDIELRDNGGQSNNQSTPVPRGTVYIKNLSDTKITLALNGHKLSSGKRPGTCDSDSDDGEHFNITPSSKRSRKDPMVCFKSILQNIVSTMFSVPFSEPFWRPVSARQIPDYYDIVRNPIDLTTIMHRVGREAYTTRAKFLEDVNQIVLNSEEYNGADDEITRVARNLHTLCSRMMEDKATELAELEAAINSPSEAGESNSQDVQSVTSVL